MLNPLPDPKDRIIVALDVSETRQAIELVEALRDHVGAFKLGLEFVTSAYARLATASRDRLDGVWVDLAQLSDALEGKLMYDGKFADIPNTVGAATREMARLLKPKFFTVHASMGIDALAAAAKHKGESKMLAVTVLTSREENDAHLTFGKPTKAAALQLAREAKLAGADGIVCSPQELAFLAKHTELESLIKVTPGVRPTGSDKGDQSRVMTPGEAIKAGADYLVIGRPIVRAPDPVAAAEAIAGEIAEAASSRKTSE